MPTEKDTHTFAAAGDRFDVMAGSIYQRPNFDYALEIALLANPGDAPTVIIASGSDLLARNSVLDEKAVTLPITTEDIQFRDTGLAGELITIEITATAAADVARWLVGITPL